MCTSVQCMHCISIPCIHDIYKIWYEYPWRWPLYGGSEITSQLWYGTSNPCCHPINCACLCMCWMSALCHEHYTNFCRCKGAIMVGSNWFAKVDNLAGLFVSMDCPCSLSAIYLTLHCCTTCMPITLHTCRAAHEQRKTMIHKIVQQSTVCHLK